MRFFILHSGPQIRMHHPSEWKNRASTPGHPPRLRLAAERLGERDDLSASAGVPYGDARRIAGGRRADRRGGGRACVDPEVRGGCVVGSRDASQTDHRDGLRARRRVARADRRGIDMGGGADGAAHRSNGKRHSLRAARRDDLRRHTTGAAWPRVRISSRDGPRRRGGRTAARHSAAQRDGRAAAHHVLHRGDSGRDRGGAADRDAEGAGGSGGQAPSPVPDSRGGCPPPNHSAATFAASSSRSRSSRSRTRAMRFCFCRRTPPAFRPRCCRCSGPRITR